MMFVPFHDSDDLPELTAEEIWPVAERVARMHPLIVGAAERLRAELERYGVRADVHECDGVALVSVRLDVLVWVEAGPEGLRYRWWTGRRSNRTGFYVYAESAAHAVEEAARRISTRYREVLVGHPASLTSPVRSAVTGLSAPGARVRPYSSAVSGDDADHFRDPR